MDIYIVSLSRKNGMRGESDVDEHIPRRATVESGKPLTDKPELLAGINTLRHLNGRLVQSAIVLLEGYSLLRPGICILNAYRKVIFKALSFLGGLLLAILLVPEELGKQVIICRCPSLPSHPSGTAETAKISQYVVEIKSPEYVLLRKVAVECLL